MLKPISRFCLTAFVPGVSLVFALIVQIANAQTVTPALTLQTLGSGDQDDMCIWVHPTDASLSTIISSDKDVNKLFVYDLDGNVVQAVSVSGEPGNIDIRYGFPLGGQKVDIVAYCDHDNTAIVVYKVDASTRTLSLVGNFGARYWPIMIYGFCLYHSPSDGKFYAIACGVSSQMTQWELVDNGNGTIGGVEKRTWKNGTSDPTEGLVADDETGKLYAANEGEGIYKYDADPTDPNPSGELIAPTGQSGLTVDVEGITLYYAANGTGYLIASSQGSDNFKIYERQPPHNFAGTLNISGVKDTDGIDVVNMPLNSNFSQGIFTCHNDAKYPKSVEVVKWGDIANALGGLIIDTEYWNPRSELVKVEPQRMEGDNVLETYHLCQNYPNPFNPLTTIRYDLHQAGAVRLSVYNVLGQMVRTLVDGRRFSGTHSVVWDGRDGSGRDVASGLYLYRLEVKGQYVQLRKMVLLR